MNYAPAVWDARRADASAGATVSPATTRLDVEPAEPGSSALSVNSACYASIASAASSAVGIAQRHSVDEIGLPRHAAGDELPRYVPRNVTPWMKPILPLDRQWPINPTRPTLWSR